MAQRQNFANKNSKLKIAFNSFLLATLISTPVLAKFTTSSRPNPNESYLLQTPDKTFGVTKMTKNNTSTQFQRRYNSAVEKGFIPLINSWGSGFKPKPTVYLVQFNYLDLSNINQFLLALKNYKPSLMEYYQLKNGTYNKLAAMSFGIYGVETKFGLHSKYFIKELFQGLVSFVKENNPLEEHDGSPNSRGLTQMKYIPESIQKLYPQITPETLRKPEHAAITTMGYLVEALKMLRALRDRQIKEGVKPGDVNLSYMTEANIFDYIPYVYSGRLNRVLNGPKGTGGATVKDNLYIQEMRSHMKHFFIMEKEL